MKCMRITGLCLIAAFVMSALAAASASAAAPEIGRCVKTALGKGKFSSSTCTAEKAGGSFEWVPGAVKNKFTTTSGGLAILETKNGTTVICKKETSGGEYTGTKTVRGVVVKFNNCASAGFACSTVGSAEGELVTHTLEGVIGVEKKGLTAKANKIAFDLFPVGKTGFFIEFSCGPLPVQVKGSVLVPLTPTNKMEPKLTLKYVATKGVQKPTKFEGEPADVLESSLKGKPFEQAGQTLTTVQTNEELLEINTVF
jgi:hypothetical protein